MQIMYDRIFLKSSSGKMTPCILVGDEEDSFNSYHPRERTWQLLSSIILDRTAEDLRDYATSMKYSDKTFWRTKDGLYTEGMGFIRWMYSGIRNAVTLEDLFQVNKFDHISAKLKYPNRDKTAWIYELDTTIKSTKDFDEWIHSVKLRALELIRSGECKSVAFVLSFPTNGNVVKPKRKGPAPKRFAVYVHHSGYLEDVIGDSIVWNGNIHKAKIFSMEDYNEILKNEVVAAELEKAKPFSTEGLWKEPYDVVLQVATGEKEGMYFAKRTKHVVYMTTDIGQAKHFKNMTEAIRLRPRIQRAFKAGRIRIVTDDFLKAFDEFVTAEYTGKKRFAQLEGQLQLPI